MSEFPEDIKRDAEEAVAGFMGWIEGGNTTASLSEHAVAGLKHSFASAILAERERGLKQVIADIDHAKENWAGSVLMKLRRQYAVALGRLKVGAA